MTHTSMMKSARTAELAGRPVVIREEIGDILRMLRQRQGRTLREISSAARVSLGYLSEVERGQKEASSELLASICEALNVRVSSLLRLVADRVAALETPVRVTERNAGHSMSNNSHFSIPDTVPAELLAMVRR